MSFCVLGIALLVVGIWLYMTIYWDNRNSPAFKEKLKTLKEKYENNEKLGFWEHLNLKSQNVALYTSKFLMVVGFLILVISCILK